MVIDYGSSADSHADVMTNPFVHSYLLVDTHGLLVKQAMASFLIT